MATELIEETAKTFIKGIVEQARKEPKHLVFPEAPDERILKGVKDCIDQGITSHITLIGNVKEISAALPQHGLDVHADHLTIVDHSEDSRFDEFVEQYMELRAHKAITEETAKLAFSADPWPTNPNYHPKYFGRMYFASMLLAKGEIDGIISGATTSTGHTLKPAFEIIGLEEGQSLASSVFFMCLADQVVVFGDSAVNPDPIASQLADIAIQSARTARLHGIDPHVGLLSFSTNKSASHSMVDKVRLAVKLAKDRAPELKIDGEMQLDAAFSPVVAARKFPESAVAGKVNVFIFPDLNAGNIGYKLVERFAKARAIGPIVQGLAKPVNDLSRGCRAEDVADVAAFTVVQAQHVDF